jgi:hypothetical protein
VRAPQPRDELASARRRTARVADRHDGVHHLVKCGRLDRKDARPSVVAGEHLGARRQHLWVRDGAHVAERLREDDVWISSR